MSDLSGLAVGLGQPCPNCRGADTARVEVVRETCRLRCRSCHADRGELPEATIKFLRDTVRAFGTPLKPVFLTRAMQGLQMKREDLGASRPGRNRHGRGYGCRVGAASEGEILAPRAAVKRQGGGMGPKPVDKNPGAKSTGTLGPDQH
jgi:hypothetical protein